MAGHTNLDIVKIFKEEMRPVMARIDKMENSIKHIEATFKDLLRITALEKEIAALGANLAMFKKGQLGTIYIETQLKKAQVELSTVRGDTEKMLAAAARMEARMAKTEMIEARLGGIETMIKSMDQSIDMLQRKR